MLKQLRKKQTAKKIFLLLAIIIIPAFVLWGASSSMRSGKEINYAGKLFGKKVSLQDYIDSHEAIILQGRMRFGDEFNKIQQEIDINKQTWVRLILLKETERQKIKISDKELVGAIQGMPFFQKQGHFDKKLYQTILNYHFHIQERDFEEKMRQSLMITKLFDKVTKDILVANSETEEEIKKLNKPEKKISAEEKDKIYKNLLEEKRQVAFRKFLQELFDRANLEDKISQYKKEAK
ncbi:MAG: SurA N-terminal domain-containing protein [Candidatus Omnitrophota bacterium]